MDINKAAMAALNGSAALAEYIVSEADEHSTAMVVVPGEPPGKNTCEMIRHLVVDRTKLIVVAQSGRLAPGNFEKLLRASMPDVERKLRVMDCDKSLAAAVNSAESNKLYSPGQALEVYCDEQQARNFGQEIRDGSLKFDPTVISVHPQAEMAKDSPDDILKACHDDDLDAMHRVLDPHIFSSHESLSEYQAALFGGGGQTEGLFTVGGESQPVPTNEASTNSIGDWQEWNGDAAPSPVHGNSGGTPSAGSQDLPAADAVKFLEANRDRLLKRGIIMSDPPKQVGVGTKGAAFELRDGRVIKVTSDQAEARASALIMKHPGEHLVKTFDVFRFPLLAGQEMGDGIYGIVKEKLSPLSESERHLFWSAEGQRQLGFNEITAELEAAGIRNFMDFHPGNIMKRGSAYVLVDPGHSNPQGGETPMLERFFRQQASLTLEFWSDVAPSKEVGVACVHDLLRWVMGSDAFEALEYLGSGRNGSAYRTPEGPILKVTTDMTEVGSALRLLGKKSRHISHIYAVQPIGDPPGLIYAILQEGGLEPLPPAYAEELDQACEVLEVAGAMYDLEVGDIKAMMGTLMDCTDPELGLMAAETLGRFGVAGMCRELQELGLKADFHSGNVMLRDGVPVLTDLGTPGDDPDLGESLTEARDKTITLQNAEKKFPNSTTLMDRELPPGAAATLMVTPEGELVANVKSGGWYRWAPPNDAYGIPDGSWSKRTRDGNDFFNKGAEHGKPSIQRQQAGEHMHTYVLWQAAGWNGPQLSVYKAQSPEMLVSNIRDHWSIEDKLQYVANSGGYGPAWHIGDDAIIDVTTPKDKVIFSRDIRQWAAENANDGIGEEDAQGMWPHELGLMPDVTHGEQKTGQGDGDRIDEFGSGSPGSGAVGPATMRSSNSSAWSGGRGAILEPNAFVPEDDNASERDGALDQDIRGAGLNWGNRRNTSSI